MLIFACQADPVTSFAGAQAAAKLLGDRATLVEQLGVGQGHVYALRGPPLIRVRTQAFLVAGSLQPYNVSHSCPKFWPHIPMLSDKNFETMPPPR